MNGRRIGVTLVLATCVLAGLTGGIATGGEKAPTKLRMKMVCKFGTCEKATRASTPAVFKGRVRSSNPDCVEGRKVKVVRKGGAPNPGPIGTTTAAANGKWSLNEPDALEGTYRAKTLREPGCKNGRSKKWTLNFATGPRAHREEFETTLTIKDKGTKFTGRVKSDSDDCTKKRLVILYGQETGEGPEEVGRVRSDKRGRWKFEFAGDHYYAEVEEKLIERGDHKHTCLFDRSPTTPFPS